MNHEELQRKLQHAESLIETGNHREARAIAKDLSRPKGDLSLTEEEGQKVERLLKITGYDPVIIGTFVLTLATIAYLYLKYAL